MVKSPEFAALWQTRAVDECRYVVRQYRHPLVGSLTLVQQPLAIPGHPEQRVVTFTAAPGSPSEAGLRLLAGLVADGGSTTDGGSVSRPDRAAATV
ncbi:MmyB family transcriptional regulator [Solihabitans fulvus]|uniref:MmyB family transcriptional regulator n=1 Tax=Solihabitans fulvus TaxID=1892852 RepID=UPI0034D3820A